MRFVKVTWLRGNNVTTSWEGVLSETLWVSFTCCPNLMFLASLWLEKYRFSNWSICWLWAVHNWYSFLLTLGKSKCILLFHFYGFGQVADNLLSLGKTGHKKQSKKQSTKWLFFWQYCQEPYLELNQKSLVELFCKNS